MTEVWHEYIPANARVVVDYEAPPKDRVKFTYPKKTTFKKALWANYFSVLTLWMIYMGIPLLLTIIIARTFPYAQLLGYYLKYGFPAQQIGKVTTIQISLIPLLVTMAVFASICAPPAITLLWLQQDKKKTAMIIPKLNYKLDQIMSLGTHRIITAKSSDIKNNVFVIPRFSNVYLDYKTTGDFSKYLIKVEVLEWPYNYKILYPNGKASKKIKNQYVWRAMFKFKQQPKTGKLYVKYV